MDNKSIKVVMKEYDKLLLILSMVSIVLLGVVYTFADNIIGQEYSPFIKSLIVELMPLGLVFVVSYFVFRKIQDIREKQLLEDLSAGISSNLVKDLQKVFLETETNQGYLLTDFGQIDWEDLFRGSLRVDIFVHYFDTWIRNNDTHLEKILQSGGAIRIILPKSGNKNLVKQIKARFPEYEESEIKTKIQKTKDKLELIKSRVTNSEATLEIYEVEDLGYYCGVRIDNRYLVLSNYDHIRDKMKIEAPTFIIKLDSVSKIKDWFEKEFNGLIDKSK